MPFHLSRALGALVALIVALISTGAFAQLSIEITGAGANRIPIAVVPFAGEGALSSRISAIVRADLERSGLFRALEVPASNAPITEASAVNFGEWRSRLADALVQGSVAALPDGRSRCASGVRRAEAGCRGGIVHAPAESGARDGASAGRLHLRETHGERGVFSTRVAYVVKRGRASNCRSPTPIWAESGACIVRADHFSWSPDGRHLAYVSFENKKPVVYVHSLLDGKRQVAANFKGSNSAPAWSPDGSRLAVVLSRDGGSQLFMVNADGSGVRRLASSSAIDTEPRFSPDGQWIYFTSDRGGSPQIYRIPANGGDAQRITFDGAYNVSARVSPDGKSLAFIARNGGKFQVALLDLSSRQTQILTDSDRDESPSFSPNGRMILLATVIGGRGVLSAVSSDGRVKQRITTASGDVREPAWGPFIKE